MAVDDSANAPSGTLVLTSFLTCANNDVATYAKDFIVVVVLVGLTGLMAFM